MSKIYVSFVLQAVWKGGSDPASYPWHPPTHEAAEILFCVLFFKAFLQLFALTLKLQIVSNFTNMDRACYTQTLASLCFRYNQKLQYTEGKKDV